MERDKEYHLPRIPQSMLKDSLAYPLGNLIDRLLQCGGNSLTLECFDSVRVGSCGHNDECNHGSLGSSFLESVIEPWVSVTERAVRGGVMRSA
jgi:hypothetical protein